MIEQLENPFTLQGKTILVTGASSGIGKATAVLASRLGASVVLVARNQQRLDETLSEMSGEGHIVLSVELTDEAQILNLVDSVPALDGAAILCRQRTHSAGTILRPRAFRRDIQRKFLLNCRAYAVALQKKENRKKRFSGALGIHGGDTCVLRRQRDIWSF